MIFINRRLKYYGNPIPFAAIIKIILVGLLLTACTEVNYLRDAQSSFSEAARLENDLRTQPGLDPQANDLLKENEVRAGYASAIASINLLQAGQIERLKSDKIWGVALTIKAMSYWRLGDYDQMQNVVNQANQVADQIYPRDKAMLQALPGLRRVDEAHAIVAAAIEGNEAQRKKLKNERREAVARLVERAVQILGEARKSAPAEHALYAYLIQSELAGYKNKLDGLQKFTGGTLNDQDLDQAAKLVSALDCAFKSYLAADNLAQARSQVIDEWKKRFGLVDDDLSCRE